MDSLVLPLVALGVFALPFIRRRWSLIVSYIVGGLIAGYGVVAVVVSVIEHNHLSGLAQILGAIAFVIGASIVVLARFLYQRATSRR